MSHVKLTTLHVLYCRKPCIDTAVRGVYSPEMATVACMLPISKLYNLLARY